MYKIHKVNKIITVQYIITFYVYIYVGLPKNLGNLTIKKVSYCNS